MIRTALYIFCKEIYIKNKSLVNTKGPLLIIANHPNSFLDAVIIGAQYSRRVYFLARGDVFAKKHHRYLLGLLNMIPVYRLREGKEFLNLNEYAFNVKIHQLKRGFGAPVYQTPFGIPKLPPMASNLIDKFVGSGPLGGVISALRGELDLGFLGQDDTVYSCELIQAFPTTLGQIQLSDGAMDGIVELNVQLSYKNWRSSANRGKPFGFNVSSLIGSSATAGAISSTIKKFL